MLGKLVMICKNGASTNMATERIEKFLKELSSQRVNN